MACTPVIDPVTPQSIRDNDIVYTGHCDGSCAHTGSGKCNAIFMIIQSPQTPNKNTKITGSGSYDGTAWARVTADGGDIENGVITLQCSCPEEKDKPTTEATINLEHRTTVGDVLTSIALALPKIIGKLIP